MAKTTTTKGTATKAKAKAAAAVAKATGNMEDTEYQNLREQLQAWGRTQLGTPAYKRVFTTDANPDLLWETYLDHFSGAERQHHNCGACRHFIKRYGPLVTITDAGRTVPVIWPGDATWEIQDYDRVFADLHDLVAKAKVTGVFLTDATDWGTPVTGDWMHMALVLPHDKPLPRAKKGTMTAKQEMAARREDHNTVSRALADFPLELLEKAEALLSSDAAYRADRVMGPLTWLKARALEKKNSGAVPFRNKLWKAIADAPDGFCHPRSSVVGSLIEDLSNGLAGPAALERFNAKMAPSRYQRATVAPTAGAIAQAERLFQELGLGPALDRRYATMEDIPSGVAVWTPPKPPGTETRQKLFGNILPKMTTDIEPLELPSVTMSWAKFARTVLPTATKIEVQVPRDAARFMALTTADDLTAPPILAWDSPEARNPVSWYYAGGVDAEMRRRVEAAGGKFTGVDVRATLMWNSYVDLDLHVESPDGYIWYGQKQAGRGWLDIDANAGGGGSLTPVENTRWATGTARDGRYRVWVRYYCGYRFDREATPFQAELEVFGQVYRFAGVLGQPGQQITLAEFVIQSGRASRISDSSATVAATTANDWGLTPGSFAAVRAIVPSPNLWGLAMGRAQHGTHTFFLLDGAADRQQGVGRGFFTEQLRGDLHPVRSVLEAHAAQSTLRSEGLVPAAGLGFSHGTPWGVTVRVTAPGGVGVYTLDRAE
jgi:hypothetical protein